MGGIGKKYGPLDVFDTDDVDIDTLLTDYDNDIRKFSDAILIDQIEEMIDNFEEHIQCPQKLAAVEKLVQTYIQRTSKLAKGIKGDE